jgi:hypothetical protein
MAPACGLDFGIVRIEPSEAARQLGVQGHSASALDTGNYPRTEEASGKRNA